MYRRCIEVSFSSGKSSLLMNMKAKTGTTVTATIKLDKSA